MGRVLANGSGNIADIIKNLQTLVTALRNSDTQLVQFNNRLATLTGVVNDSRSDLDAALTHLATAVGEVQRFISETRNQTSEQVQRLANVTQVLVDQNMALQNVLHVAPNAIANFYNDYNPDTGTVWGLRVQELRERHSRDMFGGRRRRKRHLAGDEQAVFPVLRSRVAAAEHQQSADSQPIPATSANPANIVYADPRLAPGGAGPCRAPPESRRLCPHIRDYAVSPPPGGPPPPGSDLGRILRACPGDVLSAPAPADDHRCNRRRRSLQGCCCPPRGPTDAPAGVRRWSPLVRV